MYTHKTSILGRDCRIVGRSRKDSIARLNVCRGQLHTTTRKGHKYITSLFTGRTTRIV